jgi:anaerobic magnesium-protoporphyrin IX monomethyl ester cyclase
MDKSFSTLLLMAPCRRLRYNLSDIYPVPRLGIGYLSSFLKNAGYNQTHIWDIIAEKKWIPEIVKTFETASSPDVLGISATLLSMKEAFEIAEAVKRRFPQTRIVLGGPGVSFPPEILFEYGKDVDFFIRGEGEEAFLKLIQCLDSGGSDFFSVPRLIWKNQQGKIIENMPGNFRDLNDGILSDYLSMPMNKYQLHPPMGIYPPAVLMETTRGCSYSCKFCCIPKEVRFRNPVLVEKEIIWLKKQFKINEVHFIDPTFTLDYARIEELSGRLKKLNIKWSCKTRVDLADPALLKKMADSGCYLISFGVESAAETILAHLDKKIITTQTKEAFSCCHSLGIRTAGYLMIGNPGETDETVESNIQFVKQLKPDYVLYGILQPDPASDLTQDMIKKGLFTEQDLYRYYLSAEDNFFQNNTACGYQLKTAERWAKKASRNFYLNPFYIFDKLLHLKTLQDAKNLGAGGITFIKDFLGIGRLWRP